MAPHVDLDLARAARREAEKEAPTFTLGGEVFVLPVELPLGPTRHFVAGDLPSFFSELLGDEQADRLMEHKLTLDDLAELARHFPEFYGVSLGEVPASNGSSASNGSPSRPTSNGGTRSTSRKPAGARKR